MLLMLYFGATLMVFKKFCLKHEHFISLFKMPRGQRDLSTLHITRVNLKNLLYLFSMMSWKDFRSEVLMCGDKAHLFNFANLVTYVNCPITAR